MGCRAAPLPPVRPCLLPACSTPWAPACRSLGGSDARRLPVLSSIPDCLLFLPPSLGAPLCSLLLLTCAFLALTLSFSFSSFPFLSPSCRFHPVSRALAARSPLPLLERPAGSQDTTGNTRDDSHDHHECLRSPGLRGCAFLPPTAREGGKRPCTRKSFSNPPPPGAGTAVPRVQSSKPYSRPTRVQ